MMPGVAYMRKENYEQAINAFKKCLELNPEASVREMAYYNLGLAYLSTLVMMKRSTP